LEFANQYGLLGGDVEVPIPLPIQDHKRYAWMNSRITAQGEVKYTFGTGEPLASWAKEILDMRQALELWKMVQKEDQDGLARHIKWRGCSNIQYIATTEDLAQWSGAQGEDFIPLVERNDKFWKVENIVNNDCRSYLIDHAKKGDLMKPAMYFIQEWVNDHLAGRVSPRLLWDPGDDEPLSLYEVPHSLIGALWLQFAQAIHGQKKFRLCECGTRFEVAPDTARKDKVFCSDACRARAYRRRKAEALRLYAQGKGIEDISQRVESNSETVRGWVERRSKLGDDVRL
jgi:hypothetical protein